jgi:hypothetical protein
VSAECGGRRVRPGGQHCGQRLGKGPSGRRAVHRALAGVFAGRDPERAAWHWSAAATGPDEDAAAALAAAAEAAAAKGAPQAAAAAWERAAGLSADPALRFRRLAQAAEAALSGGELDRAIRLPDDCRARMLAARSRVHFLTG